MNIPSTHDTVVAHRLIEPAKQTGYSFVWPIIYATPVVVIGVTMWLVMRPYVENGWQALGALVCVLPAACLGILPMIYPILMTIRGFIEIYKHNNPPRIDTSEPYGNRRNRVLAIANSPSSTERDHLDFGLIAGTNKPALIPISTLMENALITGPVGMGKSALVLAVWIWQILLRAKACGFSGNIIDLKLDRAMFAFVRMICESLNIPFKYFTTSGRQSMRFNPFRQRIWKNLSVEQRCQLLMICTNLDYGAGYGRDHFRDMNANILSELLTHYDIQSFSQAATLLKDASTRVRLKITDKEWQDSSHLRTTFARLGRIPELNGENDLDFMELYESPCAFYFAEEASIGQITATVIGKLAFHFYLAAGRIARQEGKTIRVFTFIDEFQVMAERGVDQKLKQARDQKTSVILSCQQEADLKTKDIDLTAAVTGNTKTKICLGALDQTGIKGMVDRSGEIIRDRTSTTDSRGGSTTISEYVDTYFTINDIREVTATPKLAILDAIPGGYWTSRYPVKVMLDFIITESEFLELSNAPWPTPPGWTPPAQQDATQSNQQAAAAANDIIARLRNKQSP